MSFPIAELITQNVVETLGRVRLPAGFNSNLNVERFKKGGRNSQDDLVTVVSFLDDEPASDDDTPLNHAAWMRPYWALVYIFEAESSPMPYDQRLDIVRADIEKALMVDTTRGGVAQNTFIRGPVRFDPENDSTGIIINFDVLYWTLDTNPYSVSE